MYRLEPLTGENMGDLIGFCLPKQGEDKDEVRAGAERKRHFLEKALQDEAGGSLVYYGQEPLGFLEFYTLETSPSGLDAPDFYWLHCPWVREGEEGKGIATMLMEKLLSRCQDRRGMIVIGYDGREHMPYSFFGRFGCRAVAAHRNLRLMLFGDEGVDIPRWRSAVEGVPSDEGPPTLRVFHNDLCPFNYLTLPAAAETAKRPRGQIGLQVHNCHREKCPESFASERKVFLDGEYMTYSPMNANTLYDEVLHRI